MRRSVATAVMLLPEAAGQADVKACQCDFTDNAWVHEMTLMLQHIEDLPSALQNLESPSAKWILSHRCEEDASNFPNTDIVLDIQSPDLTCLPEQTAMSMVCAQQWIAKKSLMGVVKWVTRVNELLQLVSGCMDAHSPVPFRANDFQTYLERFAGGVPPPQHPSFVQTLAWPTKASRKTASETKLPLQECLPLKDPECFPRGSSNPFESCSECCSQKHGPTGQAQCWQSGFDFARCCNDESGSEPLASSASCPSPDTASVELQRRLEEEKLQKDEISKDLSQQKEALRLCREDQERQAAAQKETQAQQLADQEAKEAAKAKLDGLTAENAKLKETAEAWQMIASVGSPCAHRLLRSRPRKPKISRRSSPRPAPE